MALAFEQQQKESAKAFAAFSVYLGMGAERSLAKVGQRLGKSGSLIERWSRRFGWTDRVSEHAAHLAAVEREATEALARGKAAVWLQRREEQAEDEWLWRRELVAAGRKVLKRFTEEGKGATLGDVARALELASKLGRLASGMPTEHTALMGLDGGPIQIELSAALNKIYGADAAPGGEAERDFVDVEATPVAKLPEGGA